MEVTKILDEYVGGRMALAQAPPATLATNNDLCYMILNKNRDKVILITINGETGEIESINEQDFKAKKQGGKIIQFKRFLREE